MFNESFGYLPDSTDALESALSDDENAFFSCKTAAEAAEKFGLDADTLQNTIDDYNAMCDAGVDTRYMKTPIFLQKLSIPFYIGKYIIGMSVYMGGIHTSSDMEVLTPQLEPIPGLYSIGLDSCTLYKNFYTFGGGAMGYNCYSGRKAADVIAARLKA
jgi:fumarate reductase flavoprotein subunit